MLALSCEQVVPQLIMSDLPLLAHMAFRLMHLVGGVCLYVFVVEHSFKLALLRVGAEGKLLTPFLRWLLLCGSLPVRRSLHANVVLPLVNSPEGC